MKFEGRGENKDAVKIPSPKFTCGFGNYYLAIAGATRTVINVLYVTTA